MTTPLQAAMVREFNAVKDARFASGLGTADDWRRARPRSFNCSSFAQWMALRCLGWGEEECRDDSLTPPSASYLFHAERFHLVDEDACLPGDLFLYEDAGDATAFHCMIFLGKTPTGEEHVVGACETAGALRIGPYEYTERWILRRIRRIRRTLRSR